MIPHNSYQEASKRSLDLMFQQLHSFLLKTPIKAGLVSTNGVLAGISSQQYVEFF